MKHPDRGNGGSRPDRGKGGSRKQQSSTASKPKGRGSGRVEIVFDPEERRKYLRGFSERKRERRAYGLAIQKVKDRKAKLEDRREQKKCELERIEEAELQKITLLKETLGRVEGNDDDADVQGKTQSKITYEDTATEQQWGGQVIVTTTVAPLSDDSDEETERKFKKKGKSLDTAQQYAGNVVKYMNQMKGSMPSKKKSANHKQQKGNHGAANMKGIGGATNLKMAKKVLMKVQSKVSVDTGKGKKKRKK
mmetsp:Transcript_14434/g.23871  ORF Transcript_14434/g.23871 Transcript_14434/m.23871 type:complete len:250 (-) Transcript_14434:29-778(-)|eukprot:CAMPEP_0119006790 /NCGR_PEP_ID=MMETSP1176-20130426/2543_1 /TAXON_ID=265551 /ORGANISM="Synedropsis recta cf, Strain CCMP1620" /LENGTH=249 /DNA_ID=CAMNT_0006958787 /DNA_START=51 /DNA_END=800 /DNA_ORIENTATION=+